MRLPFDIFLFGAYVTLAFSTLVTFRSTYLSHMDLWDRKKQHDLRAELGRVVLDQALFWQMTNLGLKCWTPGSVKCNVREVWLLLPTSRYFAIIRSSLSCFCGYYSTYHAGISYWKRVQKISRLFFALQPLLVLVDQLLDSSRIIILLLLSIFLAFLPLFY